MISEETKSLASHDQLPFVLGRIEGKLELVLVRLDMKDTEHAKRFDKVEDRIATLETKASRALGTAAGFFAAGSVIVLLVKYILGAR